MTDQHEGTTMPTVFTRGFRLHHNGQVLDGAEFPSGRTFVIDDPEYGFATVATSMEHLLKGYHGARVEWAPLADQAAVLREAAQHLYTALFPAVYNDLGQKAAEGVNRAVSELRRLADEAQPTCPTPETHNWGCGCPSDVAAAIASCPGHEMSPSPCRCPCEGCKHSCAAHNPESAGGEPAAGARQDGARIVAHVLATHTDLHCLRCAPPPLGDIWTPVTADELEDGGVCARCGVDVLIPQDVPTREPHPTEADLRHAQAVLDRFYGRSTATPAVEVRQDGAQR